MNRPDNRRVLEFGLLVRSFLDFLKSMCLLRSHDTWITVFGSARVREGQPLYQVARDLGRSLAHAGYSIMTGGGPGLMEAANRGAREAGGPSLGCRMGFAFEQPSNCYLDHVSTVRYFFVRKVMMCRRSIGFIVLPGGIGTLDELFEILTLIQTKRMQPKPIVLVGGEYWRPLLYLLDAMILAGTVAAGDLALIQVTDDIDDAIDRLTGRPGQTLLDAVVRPAA